MNRTLRAVRALGLAAALLAVVALAQPHTASAQPPPCCDITYTNNTGCPITFCLRTASGPVCTTVAAGGSIVLSLPPALCNNPSVYVVDRCNHNIPITGCVNVALAPNCCARICLTSGIVGCWFVTATPLAVNCLCPVDHEPLD